MRLQVTLLFLLYTEGKKKSKDNEAIARSIDVYPAPFPSPVPFGHIFREGVGDISPDQKQPIDPLELDLYTPTSEEKDKYKDYPKNKILKIVDPLGFSNPRDQYQRWNVLNAEQNAKEGVTSAPGNETDDRPAWFHFEATLERNLQTPRPAVALNSKKRVKDPSGLTNNAPVPETKVGYFSSSSFSLYKDPETRVLYDYWTTCDQFEKKTGSFLPKDITDIDWVPFYAWSTRSYIVAVVHRFSFPTRKMVKEFKQLYGPYLNFTVDWESPKLMLKEEMELLLIAGDRNGLFYGIPKMKMPVNMKQAYASGLRVPVIPMRLKIVDPYLALMFCNEYYALIMASPGTEPETDKEKISEAAILQFNGTGYPISRDLEAEQAALQAERERQQESEETRYIKAVETGYDIDRE